MEFSWLITISVIVGIGILSATGVLDFFIRTLDNLFIKSDLKRTRKESPTDKNFILRYPTDVKVLTWVCFIVFGLPCLVAIFFIFLGSNESMTVFDKIFIAGFLSLIVLTSLFAIIHFSRYRIIFDNDTIKVYKVLSRKKLAVKQIEEIHHDNMSSGSFIRIRLLMNGKTVLKVRAGYTNFEMAKKYLSNLNIKQVENSIQ